MRLTCFHAVAKTLRRSCQLSALFPIIALVFLAASLAQAQVVIQTNSVWRLFRGTNEASGPTGIEWRTNTFDDSGWEVAEAPFYLGANYTPTNGTLLSEMLSNYNCIMLRSTFYVSNAAAVIGLSNRPYADDGYIAWLNGVEIRRFNVFGSAGTFLPYYTNANISAFSGSWVNHNSLTNLIRNGTNVYCIQVFNRSWTNDFDFFANPEVALNIVNTNPPVVVSATPPFGSTINTLTNITVVFDRPVSGLLLNDLLAAGYNATNLTGSNTTYTFSYPPVPAGVVPISWDVNQVIVDAFGRRMQETENTWNYTLIDTLAPSVLSRTPSANSTVAALTQVEIFFSEPVSGMDAGDLLINNQPAASVFGSGQGPYIFQFAQPSTGVVQFAWAPGHNIRDLAATPNPFAGGNWTVNLNPTLFTGDIIINEFAAANVVSNAPLDFSEFGEADDWIELLNRGTNSVRLQGWSLTDDSSQPGLWTFPDVTMAPGQYLVVYASGRDRTILGGTNRLHTSFKLNPNGKYLGLFNAQSPRMVVSEFNPEFPEQRNDYSYGLNSSNQWRYYQTPTPGGPNGNSPITNFMAKPKVNVAHGMFEQPFTLIASCETLGATMRYTTDGSVPTETTGQIYTGPMTISNTVILRIAAYGTNSLPSRVATHSYIFLNSILSQPNNPPGYPTTWQGCAGCTADTAAYPADYEMDPEIITNAPNASMIRAALKSLPVMSLSMRPSDFFSTTNGIYANSEPSAATRYLWERACSAELFLTNDTPGFQIDCGIRVQGNASRTPSKTSKHPFRLLFKGDYGAGSLDYPLFPDSPVQTFDGIVLRADFNNGWTHWEAAQRARGTRIRDAWGKSTFAAMGQLAGHTRHVHLFLNGLYWGVYDLNERIDGHFASQYLGGEDTDWDSIVSKPTEAVDGDMVAYNAMLAATKSRDMRTLSNYTAALTFVDMTNYVDYMLLNFYSANADWGQDGNWNALHRRTPGSLFRWYVWDAERYIENTGDNRVSNLDVASGLHTNLINSPEYRIFFADRVQKHLFNGGALTSNQMAGRWLGLADVVSVPQVAESARWGDNRRDVMTTLGGGSAPFLLYDRNTNWLPEINRVATNYFPGRHVPFINQLLSVGLFSSVTAPTFSQYGGRIPAGFTLSMAATNIILYTTNGQDPRVYGTGAINALARTNTGQIAMGQSMTVKARALFNGTNWSPLVEATFALNSLIVPLRITELMYNPVGGNQYEYVELQNTGVLPLNIGNYSFGNIDFTFPFGATIAPGQRIILGNNANTNAFNLRYPGVPVAGWFGGSLNNAGETITIFDNLGRIVLSVSYDDEGGWPAAADGAGYSLEIIDPNGHPDDPANWRASNVQNGTPGQANSALPATSVLLNEVMADNGGAVNHEGTYPDWVELYNPSANNVDLSGWSMTTDGNVRKFVFPNGTTLAGNAYLVVWCDDTTNTTSGLHAGFSLGRRGESVFLYDSNSNRTDAVSFGLQVANYSIGRIAGGWTLTVPTTNAPNVAATLAPSSALSINEWLANAVPGGEDFVELFNTSASAPVALRNIYIGLTNVTFQIRSLSFIPARGYLQLIADENPGSDHVDFKLPATGGTIILYDATGGELQRVSYAQQAQGVSQGRLPDGSGVITSFPGSVSPGTTNYVINYTGAVLNELLARGANAVAGPWGNYPDYLELYNPTPTNFNLGGFGLSDDSGNVKFIFAPGTLISPNGYMVVWCDGSQSVSTSGTLNTGFSLSGISGGAYLFNPAGQVVNFVEYGFQVTDLPIGLNGGEWRLLAAATPGATNAAPATLGSVLNLRVNEWMAKPDSDGDWFELYNLDPLPVNMTGLFLTDDLSLAGQSNTVIAALSFIGGNDWAKWIADEKPSDGRNHARFDLDQDGDNIRLYNTNFAVIDSVSFGLQLDNVSQGRLPDGGTNIANFPTTPTPEDSNYLPLSNVVVNEALTHTDLPLEDAMELQNIGASSVDISGWFISDSQTPLKKFRIPAGTILTPGAFAVFYETNLNAGGNGTNFTPNSAHGDAIYLSEADAGGNMTGYRAQVSFGAAANGVSFGRFVTSVGVDFVAMSQRTFGVDNPATVQNFRIGAGLSNSYPKVGPIIINEIMYHPVTSSGSNAVELDNEEFIELHNPTSLPVPLFDSLRPTNGWKLSGGVSFNFSSNHTVAANGYVVLVNFDPATNTAAVLNFQAKYGNNGVLAGPMKGRLDNSGEELALARPDEPQQSGPDAGFVPMILVDRVVYGQSAPWPAAADGGGASLQRLASSLYGNDPLNWKAEPPTTGATNVQGISVAPTISGQPTNRTVAVGQTATFVVLANGTPPLSFQWQHAGTNLPGANSATLNVVNAQLGDAGTYTVIVSNSAGSVTSQGASLTVLAPPTIDTHPQSRTVVAGTNVQLTVVASGSPTLRYQWRLNGTPLDGETGALLNINNVQPGNAGDYTVVITNNVGATTSLVATLTVLVPPTITSDPDNVTVMDNEPATFEVSATGTAPLTYQWRKNGINIPGANSATYTILTAHASDEGFYSCFVTNIAGSATSLAGELRLTLHPFLSNPNRRGDGAFEFTLHGQTNRSYAVEFSVTLNGWTNLTNIILSAPQAPVLDLTTNATMRFYRVRVP